LRSRICTEGEFLHSVGGVRKRGGENGVGRVRKSRRPVGPRNDGPGEGEPESGGGRKKPTVGFGKNKNSIQKERELAIPAHHNKKRGGRKGGKTATILEWGGVGVENDMRGR